MSVGVSWSDHTEVGQTLNLADTITLQGLLQTLLVRGILFQVKGITLGLYMGVWAEPLI